MLIVHPSCCWKTTRNGLNVLHVHGVRISTVLSRRVTTSFSCFCNAARLSFDYACFPLLYIHAVCGLFHKCRPHLAGMYDVHEGGKRGQNVYCVHMNDMISLTVFFPPRFPVSIGRRVGHGT